MVTKKILLRHQGVEVALSWYLGKGEGGRLRLKATKSRHMEEVYAKREREINEERQR